MIDIFAFVVFAVLLAVGVVVVVTVGEAAAANIVKAGAGISQAVAAVNQPKAAVPHAMDWAWAVPAVPCAASVGTAG